MGREIREFSEFEAINRISHGRRIEEVVHRVPGVAAEPVRAKGVIPFLRFEASRALPVRALILADEQTGRGSQIMGTMKKHRNPRLRIRGRNFCPGAPRVRAPMDALALAVNEG